VVEGARLESVYRGNSIEGSNPSLSAIIEFANGHSGVFQSPETQVQLLAQGRSESAPIRASKCRPANRVAPDHEILRPVDAHSCPGAGAPARLPRRFAPSHDFAVR
jgi:hypothetical protein